MSLGTAALAASLNLKTADLLRVLSSNMGNGGLLCEAPKPVNLNGDFMSSPSESRKRCRSAETAHTDEMMMGEEDDELEDGISDDMPPHKMSHHSSPTLDDGHGLQKPSFRGELKRPDLKGSFRCTICQKVFCHSSSLSRHRMQAHFKSYTCTLCSKEITSNETLRAHMLKQHQISRMFMCRCCNWAFPDKTSLHMHMQLQGKPDQREAANVPVIGKSNQPDTSVTPNALNNNNKPSNDPPLLLPNALFSTGQQPQLNGLFPPMPIDSLLNLNTLQQQAQAQQSQIPSIFKPAGLFPQLSMMRGDNVDLLSKLRQRLFLTSMWAQQQNQQKAFMPGQEKMLADFLENNNQLLSEQAPIGQSLNPQQVAMTSSPPNNAETDKARQNLAQLMDMLQRNAENNNNNSVKTNMNTEEADSNNNNNNSSTDQFKSNQVEDEDNLNSVEIDEDDFENEIGEVPLNFVTPTLNQQQNSSIVSNNEQLNDNAHFLQKQNANMEKMIQEIRVKLNAFLEKEKLTTEQKEFLFSLLTKLE